MIYINARQGGGFTNQLGCFIFGGILLIVVFSLLRGVFNLLWFASPVLVVIALVINHKVVLNTFSHIIKLFRTRPVSGIIRVVMYVVFFPVLALYWCLSAFYSNKIEQIQKNMGQRVGGYEAGAWDPFAPQDVTQQGDFAEYEELDSRPKIPLKQEVPPPPNTNTDQTAEKKKPQNPYDGLFE